MSFEPIKHSIQVSRTARYFASGNIDQNTRAVWIVVHGYAQHAGYFLKKFEPLFSPESIWIAPEGLSRFYLRGTAGKVGASWMTSEDRLDEINDYVRYLDQVLQALALPPNVAVNVLGFSQGVATVARWVSAGKIQPERVVLYAGVFPPDLDPAFGEKWKTTQIDVLVGDSDEYYKPEVFEATYAGLKDMGAALRFHRFAGGHEIFAPVLQKLLD